MSISVNKFQSIEQISEQIRSRQGLDVSKPKGKEAQKTQLGKGVDTFAKILQNQNDKKEKELKFSHHAAQRLASRNIDLTGEQKQRLEMAVSLADTKGIQESLVMLDDMAFIVNIPNHTVITAVNPKEDATVFTNIDGAVIS